MQTLKLDPNNNLIVENGNLVVIDGIYAAAQNTRTRLGLCRGENPYDIQEGIDYFNELLGKLGGMDYIREEIRRRILDSPDIVKINSLDIISSKGTITVTADITSVYGTFTL